MSEKIKHTPGPWNLHDERNDWHIHSKKHGSISVIPKGGANQNFINSAKANAHLIAAAPEMYEALKNLENDNGAIPNKAWSLIQKAIEKAEGKEAQL